MSRWLSILVVGMAVMPYAAETLTRMGGFSADYRDGGETLAPERIHSSWGKRLNPAGAIPKNGFKAIYFNRQNPEQAVSQENVASIAVKYAWNELHGIQSEQFGGYWVGNLNVDQATTKQISVSLSRAKARIFIDGEVIFDAVDRGTTFPHAFTAGDHVIEVEYVNNWHTTEFKVTVESPVEKISEPQVAAAVMDGDVRPTNLYYVGLYESAATDTSANVILPRTGKRVVLWLSSYEAVDWNIVSSDPVTSVFVNSHEPGSRVHGATVGRVLQVDRSVALHSENKRCSCVSGYFHCEDESDLDEVAERLRSATGMRLTGYAVGYSAAEMAVRPYTDDDRRRVLDQRTASEQAKRLCTANANPDFDKLMGDAGKTQAVP